MVCVRVWWVVTKPGKWYGTRGCTRDERGLRCSLWIQVWVSKRDLKTEDSSVRVHSLHFVVWRTSSKTIIINGIFNALKPEWNIVAQLKARQNICCNIIRKRSTSDGFRNKLCRVRTASGCSRNYLAPWCKVFSGQLSVVHVAKKLRAVMKPKCSSPCSQQPVILS
jgi:hypothetical protein